MKSLTLKKIATYFWVIRMTANNLNNQSRNLTNSRKNAIGDTLIWLKFMTHSLATNYFVHLLLCVSVVCSYFSPFPKVVKLNFKSTKTIEKMFKSIHTVVSWASACIDLRFAARAHYTKQQKCNLVKIL